MRGLRLHVRCWGDPADPPLVLLHGWMDVSASFQFMVDALDGRWHVLAPDWRGFGLSQWAPGGYWFADYLADLDAILDLVCPGAAVPVVGHSMGGNVANLYAGVRPERVSALVLAEGFGLRATTAGQAPERYGRWLDELREGSRLKPYADFCAVADRLMSNNPRLTRERAQFLSRHWAREADGGGVEVAADPAHKRINPVLYRFEEAQACWQRIRAPVLWVWGGEGEWVRRWMGEDPADLARRRAAYARLSEVTIREAGHMMHQDQPEAFAAAVESFIAAAGSPP
ncbi:MAG: alpha/beta fold hydrolase [Betaproteobacteria bacterium]